MTLSPRSRIGQRMGRQTKPIAYSEEIRPQDTVRALETVKPQLFPNETNPKQIVFNGDCPRCGHPIDIRILLFAVNAAVEINDSQREAIAFLLDKVHIDLSHGDQTFDITCSCTFEHPHYPKDKKGCGARFRVRVRWPMAKLINPDGFPSPSSSAEEEEWASMAATQLANVRKAAENWRNGLAAIIGLITVLSVIKGPDNVSGLDPGFAHAVGALLFLALAFATFGAWMSLTAAYGEPSIIGREAVRERGGINVVRLDLAENSLGYLFHAKIATVLTLLFIVVAVALTWYGPRSASVILDIERKSLPNVCGQLVSSKDGYVDIKPSTREPVRVYMNDIVKVSAVEVCP